MKTIYIVWYKSEHNEGPCFRGRVPFWTTDYNNALDYKCELEENCKGLGESATFSVVRFEVKE
jgi:hypothetical protein